MAAAVALSCAGCQVLGTLIFAPGGAPGGMPGTQGERPGTAGMPEHDAIVGQVLDEAGRAASGVLVRAHDADRKPGAGLTIARSARTDAGGYFSLLPDHAGRFNLEAEADARRKAWRAAVDWGGGGTRADAGTLRLAPVGHISGRVRVASGDVPVPDALVDIPGSPYAAVTDAKGEYTLEDVPAGSFDLIARHDTLGRAQFPNEDYPARITVRPGQKTVAASLVLVPDAGDGGAGPDPLPTAGPTPVPPPGPSPEPTPSTAPTPSPEPTATPGAPGAGLPERRMVATLAGGTLAPDDPGDPLRHHDYTVARDGAESTFVWIPRFKAYQLVRPDRAGFAGTPVGYWMAYRPVEGAEGVDWAEETFGGFYAAKYEASEDPDVLAIGPGRTPWTGLAWDEAVAACAKFHPRAHLMGDEEWTALAVWSMLDPRLTIGQVQGNTTIADSLGEELLPGAEGAAIRFAPDPAFEAAVSGPAGVRALTGSATAPGWAPGMDWTTHTGGSDGVHDLAGNVAEWTRTLTRPAAEGQIAIDGVTWAFALEPGFVLALSTDPPFRRVGLPGATSYGEPAVPHFGRDWYQGPGYSAGHCLRGGDFTSGGIWWLEFVDGEAIADRAAGVGFRPCLRF